MIEILTALFIHLAVPVAGVLFFLFVVYKMRVEKIIAPPNFEYFIIFAIYGSFILVILTQLFWSWSGLASLGVFFLILVAPFIMAGVAFSLFSKRKYSKYHFIAFIWALLYIIILPLLCLLFYLNEPDWIG